jgi:hypothetical protein
VCESLNDFLLSQGIRGMARIKSILGYTAASLTIIVSLATFIGNDYFGKKLVATTGLIISPWITGGKIVQSIDHGDYKTEIFQTVFRRLFSDMDKGFVQIEWVRINKIPDVISEDIDYDNDGKIDFRIDYNTLANKPSIMPINPKVIAIERQYRLKNSYAVRVALNRN